MFYLLYQDELSKLEESLITSVEYKYKIIQEKILRYKITGARHNKIILLNKLGLKFIPEAITSIDK